MNKPDYTDTLRLLGLALDRNEAEIKRLERIARGSPERVTTAVLQALRAVVASANLQRQALLRAVRAIDAETLPPPPCDPQEHATEAEYLACPDCFPPFPS